MSLLLTTLNVNIHSWWWSGGIGLDWNFARQWAEGNKHKRNPWRGAVDIDGSTSRSSGRSCLLFNDIKTHRSKPASFSTAALQQRIHGSSNPWRGAADNDCSTSLSSGRKSSSFHGIKTRPPALHQRSHGNSNSAISSILYSIPHACLQRRAVHFYLPTTISMATTAAVPQARDKRLFGGDHADSRPHWLGSHVSVSQRMVRPL
jgi:hypothetical protein